MTEGNGVNFELDELLHPAQAFDHPADVVNDPDLTLNEKRAILASWSSEAYAVEAAPELRTGPKAPVRFDDIMEALRALDKQANSVFAAAVSRGAAAATKGDRSSRCRAMKTKDCCIIGRGCNVVRVNFRHPSDPSTPKFPGAAALRRAVRDPQSLNVCSSSARKGGQSTVAITWAASG
jgi:hypothetical protein